MTTKVLECDLVVIGGGGAGLIAAVKVSDGSGKKVIVLEKAKNPGGSTYFAGGPGVGSMGGPGAGSRSGAQGSAQSAGGNAASQGGPGSGAGGPGGAPGGSGGQGGPGGGDGGSQSLMAAFNAWFAAKVGAENFEKGARMAKFKELPDPSIGPGRGGTFTVEKMVEFCQKQGIQILTETPAKKLIANSSGKITAVLADSPGGEVQVNCKACIIASGGFGRNYEMLRKHWPEEYNNKEIFFLCPPGITGDGIIMAEAIGAYIDQTKWSQSAAGGFFASGPIHHPYSWAVQSMMGDSRFVAINLDGKRWIEGGNGGGRTAGSSLGSQPGGGVYKVADSEIVEAVGNGLITSGSVGPGGQAAGPDSNEAKAIKKWSDDLEYECAIDDEGASGRHARKANSLVELALKMGVDPAGLLATIEDYNKAVEAGTVQAGGMGMPGGMDGGKPTVIRKPPFYAIWGHRFSQCTKGLNGIAVTNDFQVLNPKGEVMPGLYAAGDTCTIFGGLVLQRAMGPGSGNQSSTGTNASDRNILHTMPSPCGGSTAAMVSGHIAGTHAAEYLKKL
jgi:hypothetical protein